MQFLRYLLSCAAFFSRYGALPVNLSSKMIELGGHLILRNGYPLMFTHGNPTPLEGQPDIVAHTVAQTSPRWPQSIASTWVGRSAKVSLSGVHANLSLLPTHRLIRQQHFLSFSEDAPRCVSSGVVVYVHPSSSRGILCFPQGVKRNMSFGFHYGLLQSTSPF